MAEIIEFPKKKAEKQGNLEVLRSKCHIIDLVQTKKELMKMQDEMKRIKRRLNLKLIKDESTSGKI